jgi:hypothetical protein
VLAGRRRAVSHRRNDASLSPEGRPWSRPSTEMSSSSAGQWIPTPGPTNSHCSRSPGEPWTRRGYHRSGTETVRPSRSSTTSARGVTRADFASAVSISRLEVLIPRFQQVSLVLANEALDSLEFVRREAEVVRLPHGREPELRRLVLASDVHMNRLGSIAREEEEPIRATPQNRWAHGDIFAGSGRGVTEETVPTTPISTILRHSRKPATGTGPATLSR